VTSGEDDDKGRAKIGGRSSAFPCTASVLPQLLRHQQNRFWNISWRAWARCPDYQVLQTRFVAETPGPGDVGDGCLLESISSSRLPVSAEVYEVAC
jgi:hypothetical protein